MQESWPDSGPGMARSVSGGAPPPSRAPEDRFKTAPQKASSGPTLERRSLCTPSGQRPRARQQPARTGRGPSPASCGQSREKDRRVISVQLDRVMGGQSRALPVYEVGWSTALRAMIGPIPKLIVRLAVWVAVQHRAAASRADRSRKLVQLEPIRITATRAASAPRVRSIR